MTPPDRIRVARLAAFTALAGSACANPGASLLLPARADLDAALAADDMAGYFNYKPADCSA